MFSVKGLENLPGGDARENPPDPKARVKKNLEEGRGFRLDDAFKGGKGGDFTSLLALTNFGELL